MHLIFLISQPRAGSTMLQRILAGHGDVQTLSEPWLMLHPFYALRQAGYEAEYNAGVARGAVLDFLQSLPRGEQDYLEGLRRMYLYLYDRALAGSGKHFFLDKTPRYYFVIPELLRTFPEAHFIILLRNPLGVLNSVLSTRVRENWYALHKFKHDLLRAPQLILAGLEQLGDKAIVVHYEQLLQDPTGGTQ